MPTPDWVKDRARKRRERDCLVCGKHFLASRPSAKGLCSPECQRAHFAKMTTGRTQTEETKRKRAVSIANFRAQNPDAERARVEAARQATQTDEYRLGALQRYLRMQENGTGICSQWVRGYTAERAKWLMTKARQALEAETDFIDKWRETLERLRREHPYDGPMETSDYFDYCKMIGRLMTADPELRAIQDDFFRGAIPRFGAEWDAQAIEDRTPVLTD